MATNAAQMKFASLPFEVLIEIGQILREGDLEHSRGVVSLRRSVDDSAAAFEASHLRSTSRLLDEIYRPLAFSQLATRKWQDKDNVETEYCSLGLAEHITDLILHPIRRLQVHNSPERPSFSFTARRKYPKQLITDAINVRKLKLICMTSSTVDFDLAHLGKLKQLDLISMSSTWFLKPPESFWQGNDSLEFIWSEIFWDLATDQHQSLVSLGIVDFSLSLEALVLTRESFHGLKYLRLEDALPESVREEFGRVTYWHCGSTLSTLVLRRCGGAHATHIARLITSGTFPNLRTCILMECGSHSDDPNIPPPPFTEWKHSRLSLESLEIHHFNNWELKSLSRIRTKRLRFSQIREPDFDEFFGSADRFGKTLEVIEAEKQRWRSGENLIWDQKIRDICTKRGVRLEL